MFSKIRRYQERHVERLLEIQRLDEDEDLKLKVTWGKNMCVKSILGLSGL